MKTTSKPTRMWLPRLSASTGDGVKVHVDPTEDLRIGRDLDREMSQQPGLFAHYAGLAAAANAALKRAKYEVHCTREDLDPLIRKEIREGRGRITENEVKIRVNRHPKMRGKYETLLRATEKAAKLDALKEAFKQRSEMLRSMGANRRNEGEGSREHRTLDAKVSSKLKRDRK